MSRLPVVPCAPLCSPPSEWSSTCTPRSAGPRAHQPSSTTQRSSTHVVQSIPPQALASSFPSFVVTSPSSECAGASQLPASSHLHRRAPLLHHVLAVNNTKWSALIFPAPSKTLNPAHDLPYLQSWFDNEWSQIEISASKHEQHRRNTIIQGYEQPSKHYMQQLMKDATHMNHDHTSASTSVGPPILPSNVLPSLSTPSLLVEALPTSTQYLLIQSRIKLCNMTYKEIIRHLRVLSPSHAKLCEDVHNKWHELLSSLYEHNLNSMRHILINEYENKLLENMNQLRQKRLKEVGSHREQQVELLYCKAELSAKNSIIKSLQIENDKDLLYSNQIVCQKEMNYLKLEREYKNMKLEHMKICDELKLCNDDKFSLEHNVHRLEEEREDLLTTNSLLQNKLDDIHMRYTDNSTQYDTNDLPKGVIITHEEQHRHKSAKIIQCNYRGYRCRKRLIHVGHRLKKKIRNLQSKNAPYICVGFLHLISPIDAQMNREHFVRLFARKNLLKWISKLYSEKIIYDNYCIKSHKSGKELCDFIYEYYLMRHGTRDACEMDLLDLFASLQKHADSSCRIRLFSMFLNHAFQLRKIGRHKQKHNQNDKSSNNSPSKLSRFAAGESASNSADLDSEFELLLSPASFDTRTALGSFNSDDDENSNNVDASKLAQEKKLHELKLRCLIHAAGGKTLSDRVCKFYLNFLSVTKKMSVGAFQSVGDNNEGIMWVDLSACVELLSKILVRFPAFILDALLLKLQSKSQSSRLPSTLNQSRGANARTAPAQCIEWDVVAEVAVEAVIDEETRMFYRVYEAFLNTNPGHVGRDRLNIRRFTMQNEESEITEPFDPETNLEPEMFTFLHFSEVLKSLGINWDDDQLLRVFALSTQSASFRPVRIEDFVTTVRCFGVCDIDCEWGDIEIKKEIKKEEIALDAESDDDEAETAQMKSQELREKIRELEINYTSKAELMTRKHEKEIAQLKISHERELQALIQSNNIALEQLKRQNEQGRLKAEQEYKQMMDEKNKELTTLKNKTIKDQQLKTQLLQENLTTNINELKTKLTDSEQLSQALQLKLLASNDKLRKRKHEIVALEERVLSLESQVANLGGSTNAASTAAIDANEHSTVIKQRKIIARLSTDLDDFKMKFNHLVDRLNLNPSSRSTLLASLTTNQQADRQRAMQDKIEERKKLQMQILNANTPPPASSSQFPSSNSSSASSSPPSTASHLDSALEYVHEDGAESHSSSPINIKQNNAQQEATQQQQPTEQQHNES